MLRPGLRAADICAMSPMGTDLRAVELSTAELRLVRNLVELAATHCTPDDMRRVRLLDRVSDALDEILGEG